MTPFHDGLKRKFDLAKEDRQEAELLLDKKKAAQKLLQETELKVVLLLGVIPLLKVKKSNGKKIVLLFGFIQLWKVRVVR
jgi:hypothetical protein